MLPDQVDENCVNLPNVELIREQINDFENPTFYQENPDIPKKAIPDHLYVLITF